MRAHQFVIDTHLGKENWLQEIDIFVVVVVDDDDDESEEKMKEKKLALDKHKKELSRIWDVETKTLTGNWLRNNNIGTKKKRDKKAIALCNEDWKQ